MGIFEAQQVGHFAYGKALHHEILGLIDYKAVDIADGGAVGGLMDYIAEISGGISQLRSAPCDGGEPHLMLQAPGEILNQKAVEAFEDVAFTAFFLCDLAQVDSLAVFQNQFKVACKDIPESS